MSIWGVRPAQGRLKFCGSCGASIVFVEARQAGVRGATPIEAVMAAIGVHHGASPRCRTAETFDGEWIVACRCPCVMPVARDEGLWCARCDGRVAPALATAEQVADSSPKGGS